MRKKWSPFTTSGLQETDLVIFGLHGLENVYAFSAATEFLLVFDNK